jgi:hemerythrin
MPKTVVTRAQFEPNPTAEFSAPELIPADGRSQNIIDWDPLTMETGVESVDREHRELIEKINDLHRACLAGVARTELLKLLNFLGNYAKSHFSNEEGLMVHHHCPAAGANKEAHARFLQDFQAVLESVKKDGATTTAVLKLREMLGNWLKHHICRTDHQLKKCVRANGHCLTA